jgi:DNA adenine methylase
MGGKHRQGPMIAEFVKIVLKPKQWYVEPFCGALGAAWRVNHSKMVLADISESLITMWQFFQNNPNFELPDVITEKEYNEIKNIRDPKDWRTAYYGFGMSFGSKWFGGYARNEKGINYCANLKRSTNLKRSINARFVCSDYKKLKIPKNSVIYCDPPYENRTKAHDFKIFNTEEFWQWCRDMVELGHIVLVTSFVVPNDFVVLYNWGDTVVRHYSGKVPDGTSELLVCHESQYFKFVS